jgi:hypothetical protein
MGRRLEARLRKLEEEDAEVGATAALQRLTDAELRAFIAYGLRAQDAGPGGTRPTPEEADAIKRFHALRRQALT